jgi:NAD(P)-dependent dehydrogenase (short-subunit alcohol dehydrogenase family)
MKITGSVALVTGANRGIGRAFIDELLKRGAAKIYVAARNPASLADLLQSQDGRLVPLTLDVTDEAQVRNAAKIASDVTLLINNAGVAGFHGAISAPDLSLARQEMDVNYFGPLSLIRAFAPRLAASGGGAIVNLLSFLSLVTMPKAGTYSASKAAALALTRSVRAELAAQGTAVVAVMPVQVETDMGRDLPEPRLTPQEVAAEALDAVESGLEDVFPGELTRQSAGAFAKDPKGVQAHLSKMIPERV